MGNVLNSGENNDDLVDILRLLRYIESKKVERVFRAVDRGDYVLASHRDGAYKDVSWKIGNIHLSAPCVYSKVMEGLSLEEGLSFLNVGSGTGYLSTMAGLILGHHGTNHGIELNKDCMEYAYERLDEFKRKSLALNEFDFCEPVFIHGNFLRVIPNRQYDRVYCGAACPESHEAFMKQFVKVGGILVMPYKDHLLRIKRISTDKWKHRAMLPVAFAALVVPGDDDQTVIQLPSSEPLSLQELSRCSIRSCLRQIIWIEHPDLEIRAQITSATPEDQNPNSNHVQSLTKESDSRSSSDEEEDPGTSSRTRLLVYMDSHPSRTLQAVRDLDPSKLNRKIPGLFEESESDEDSKPPVNKKISIDSMISTSSSSSSSSCLKEEMMIIDEKKFNSSTNKNESLSNDINTSLINNKTPEMIKSTSKPTDDDSLKFENIGESSKSSKRDNSKNIDDFGETSGEKSDLPTPAKKKKGRKLLSKKEIALSSSCFDGNGEESSDRCDWSAAVSSTDDDEGGGKGGGNSGIHDFVWDSHFGVDLDMSRNEESSNRFESPGSGENGGSRVFAHNVNVNDLSEFMKWKIRKLPLPISLQLYVNYDRDM